MKKTTLLTALLCVTLGGAALFAQTTEDEWFAKAGEYSNRGDYANAVTAYTETVKRNSSNLNAYLFRGFSYFQLKNYDAAIADCDTVIKGAPDYPEVYMLRGDAYGAKGVYHKAAADYRTGFEKGYDPSSFNVDKSSKADMWFCGAMYMEIVTNRFLGKPAVVTAYENRLKTVCDKSGVTRAEVEAFYRQNIGSLIAAAVDAEFKDIAIAANTKTAIKQAISGFFLAPNQTNYNGLKRYKYQNGRMYSDIEFIEFEAANELENAEYFKAKGDAALAESSRKASETARNLANNMKAANAYIYTLRALHPALADKVLRESR
jgi:hypothetical protein